MIKIEIKTDNAAFHEEGSHHTGNLEIARILKALSDRIEHQIFDMPLEEISYNMELRDRNGNVVGDCVFINSDPS